MKKIDSINTRMQRAILNSNNNAAPNEGAAVRPPTTHQENYRCLMNETCGRLFEK